MKLWEQFGISKRQGIVKMLSPVTKICYTNDVHKVHLYNEEKKEFKKITNEYDM